VTVEHLPGDRPRVGLRHAWTISSPLQYWRSTVRGKLVGIVLLTTVIVLVISGIAMLAHDLSVYRIKWASDVAGEAGILAMSSAPAMAFNDLEVAQRNLDALQVRSAVLAAALYGVDGQLYAQFSRAGEESPPARRPAGLRGVRVAGERVELTQQIEVNGEHLGTLYLRARYDVVGRVQAYLGIFSLITILSLLAAFALSAVLQRVFTVPLEEIGHVARQIVHEHDYSLRVKQTTQDEIGLAVQALNSMLDEVQLRARALEESNASLREEVSVRHAAETALARANARLETTLAAAEIGSWVADLRTENLVVDHNFAALYGIANPGVFVDIPTLRLQQVHANDLRAVLEAETEALAIGTLASPEFRIVQPDGSVRWVIERGKVQFDANGKPSRLAGLLIDITPQKLAEQQRRETEKVYRAIGESIAYGVWVTDAEGRCTYASDSFLRLLGMTQEQCSDFGWASLLHPDEADDTLAAWRECVRTGSAWYREHRIRGADGTYHPVLAQGVPIRGDDGSARGWAGINLDISRLKRTEEALREADRRKDEFVATLAHELRNPLAPIRHATHILDSPGANEAQLKWGREVITRQVEHMALLLDDLLDVSRITRGRLDLKTSYVSIGEIVAAAIETARPLIDAKRHTVQIQVPEGPLELNVDPLRLSQALSNLLTNAAKYTDAGGKINLSVRRDATGVAIAVQDSGIGLHESSIPRVFDMFSQVESAMERSQGGLGIGLALVKGLVMLHGGTVEAASDGPGHGSTFTIHLPNACIFQEQLEEEATRTPAVPPAGPRCTLLVVDDNRDAAEALAMVLRLAGHEVAVGNSGQQALEIARRKCPDACILDIGMPGMSGYEVARAMREQPWGKTMLLIALTGWGQREDVDRARAAGFDHHFTKPIDAVQIERLLAAFGEMDERSVSTADSAS
jgi:PAS domain S-box-containing protein